MPAEQPVRRLLEAAAADEAILGKRWRKAAGAACKTAKGTLGQPTGRKRWEDNKAVNAAMKSAHEERATAEKFNKKEGRKKSQSVFPDKVHAARAKKHGHAYPAVTARPHTVLGYSMQRQLSASAHFHNGCTHQGRGTAEEDKKNCPHCEARVESEEHALLWCPKHEGPRRKLLQDIGWPRNETQLVSDDAVRWMVPDAAQAACSDGKMATAVQEFCTAIAWTRGSREAAAKKTRRAAENEDDGDESAIDGEAEESEAEEDEQRPRSSFSGFSGVVPTQTTAPAREPREIRRSVRLRATK